MRPPSSPTSTRPRVPVDAYRPTFVKAMVMMPVGPGIKFASIGVYWAKPHRASAYELELLQSLASTADLALSGVRAYQEACRARAEAEQANRLKDESWRRSPMSYAAHSTAS